MDVPEGWGSTVHVIVGVLVAECSVLKLAVSHFQLVLNVQSRLQAMLV